jgi:hypothetical protein
MEDDLMFVLVLLFFGFGFGGSWEEVLFED